MTEHRYVTIALSTLLMAVSLVAIFALVNQKAYTDSLTGGTLTQRIGNVDVELKTLPENPVAGEKTTIFLRFGNINGVDLVDTPINVKITKQGEEVHKIDTITVPDGHYTYSYRFAEPDIYGLIVEIENYAFVTESMSSSRPSETGTQSLLFTFPISINSKSPFGLSGFQISLVIGSGISVIVIFFFYWRRRNTTRKPYQQTGKN